MVDMPHVNPLVSDCSVRFKSVSPLMVMCLEKQFSLVLAISSVMLYKKYFLLF